MRKRPTGADDAETFWFGPVGWDVEKAKKLINARPVREPTTFKVADLASQLSWVYVDEKRAKKMPALDPSGVPQEVLAIPIIFGCMPESIEAETPGKVPVMLIDGHHRLWRFIYEKIETIQGYYLTPEENKQIELGDAWQRMRLAVRKKKGAKKP